MFENVVLHRPEYLWLLLLAPLFFFRRKKHSRSRGSVILTLRLLIFALLVTALAGPHVRRRNDAVTSYFLLDFSGSVPKEMRTWSLDVVRRAAQTKPRKEDRAGLIVFGRRAIVEESPTPHFDVGEVYSVVDGSDTDLASAIRLALSTFPDDTQKRIVLFSDGNATRGDAAAAVQRAVAEGCPVDVVPLRYEHKNEVLLESLTLPRRVKRDDPFQIRANVHSLSDQNGRIRIYCDGQVIGQKDVALHAGDNVFVFSHSLRQGGFHLFEAEAAGEKDGLKENNRGQAYTIIEDESVVLLAADSAEDVRHLATALQEEGIAARIRLKGRLPQDLGEWQSYDAILFANLGADTLSREQMEMIESLVRDLGVGFIMIGGEKSYGAGGYLATPVERILPVNLEIEQKKVLPNGGIAFLLDHIHCIGDRWSKDICVGTANSLTRFDHFGMRAGGHWNWIVPLEAASDKEAIAKAVNAAHVRDISDIDAELERVIAAFSASRCSYRHAVLITDGTGNIVPSAACLRALQEAKITLSVVVIEPRGMNLAALEDAARAAGGNFYIVQPHEYERVPQIFIRESALVKKGLYYEETFTPSVNDLSEILEGIEPSEIPPLHGYNVTSRKDPTEIALVSDKGDAVLAQWQCGLGRSVAFTSDAASRWGSDWVSWNKYRQFWSQAVRWCQRRLPASPYHLTIQKGREDGTCEVILDAQDEKGNFVNFLSPEGMLVRPSLEGQRLRFDQTAPGRYRAAFAAAEAGGYVVNVQYREKGVTYLARGGYVPSYNQEYSRLEDDEALLLSIADRTGGRAVGAESDLFLPTGAVAYTSRPFWPLLLLIAVCLIPLDIFVRRVIVGPRDFAALVRRIVPGLRVIRAAGPDLLTQEREAIRARSVWRPKYASAESVTVEGPGAPEAAAPEEVEEIELSDRLLKAKKRAKRQYDK